MCAAAAVTLPSRGISSEFEGQKAQGRLCGCAATVGPWNGLSGIGSEKSTPAEALREKKKKCSRKGRVTLLGVGVWQGGLPGAAGTRGQKKHRRRWSAVSRTDPPPGGTSVFHAGKQARQGKRGTRAEKPKVRAVDAASALVGLDLQLAKTRNPQSPKAVTYDCQPVPFPTARKKDQAKSGRRYVSLTLQQETQET